MKLKLILSTSFASAIFACAANAQAPYGPWVHNAGVPMTFFVSPTGSNSNGGLDSANAFATLDHAVAQADIFLGALFPTFASGVTINVLPGTYTLTQPLSLPAFGLSIEKYWDSAAGTVTITGNVGGALFDFDHMVGPFTASTIGIPDGLPPSAVRGLRFTNNPSGPAIQIDPTVNATADELKRTVEVEINQCLMSQCTRGVMIQNQGGLEVEYRNVIVSNQIGSCAVGIEAINAWYESDLFRSNRIIGAMTAMRFDGSGAKAGMLHPRVLSNTIHNSSFLVGLSLTDCSARIVNNTMGFVTVSGGTTQPTTIRIASDGGGSTGESIVIANNILFSPAFTIAGTLSYNPPEITIAGTPFAGSLTVVSNDFDNSGALFAPPQAFSPTNIGIANAQFVAAPGDLHLTATSPSITNLGNQSFVVPGPTATITLNGVTVPANCALDLDLDPRTHMQSGGPVDVLHRGSDQFIETGVRLRTATAGTNPLRLADAFGNLKVDSAGNATVDLLLDLPVGSVFVIALGAALPMGPEMQHAVLTPLGSLAIDPNSPNGTTILSGGPTTVSPHPVTWNLGLISPAFTEAEMYLQAIVFLPNGVTTFTNRIRLDIDGI